jgi:dipeptidyl aminopeptidase/acylaminoacyl peptidase
MTRQSLTLLAALLAIPAAAQTLQPTTLPPTIDQSLEMRTVAAPQISPDGTRVVYELTRTNWESNAFETELWIATIATGESHRLTASSKSSNSASWSPDGKSIAFLSNRPGSLPKSPDGERQLYLMPANGGEAQQVTKMEHGINAFEWAPDGKSFVFTAQAPESKEMKARKETFGDYNVIHADYPMAHLWRIEAPTNTDPLGPASLAPEAKLLTPGEAFSVGSFAISPDGTRIAFSAQRDPDLISAFSADIYLIPTTGGEAKKIVESPGPDTDPKWSPDGTQIAYVTADANPNFFFTNRKIAIVPASGGKPNVVSSDFDEDPNLIQWTKSGIAFVALQRTASRLFLLDPKTSIVLLVLPEDDSISNSFTFSSDLLHFAFRRTGPNQFAEIYVCDTATIPTQPHPNVKSITHMAAQLSGLTTAHEEVVHWTSSDGTPIEGILYKPADFSPTMKYPLLVIIHGGPTGIDTPAIAPDRYYPIQRWVAKGALILRPNYRGSAGYGEKFRSLNVRNLGVGDYADVISGVDSLIHQGFVDPARVGAMGWSEGGYISAFISTFSDRFKAVSVGAGISDWATYYANTDITPFTRQYLKSTPWDDPTHGGDPEIYRKTSPITYISHAQTPTLIQQGSVDRRVPVPDSFELRQALEDHGVPVKMVLYDGFGHPINKPKQQRAVMEENENWFNHYIFGEPLAPALTPITKPEKP